MLFGRPQNLVLAAVTGVFNVVVLVLAALVPPIVIPAVVVGAANLALAAVIAVIAYQPPSINVGDGYTVVTPGDLPNVEKVANALPTPPANLVPKGG